uniref:Uncharacterized protein n=2 Tax=Palpitomonas bilix TaxID=652834 RepID=A0A7S3GDT2_9EUKA|mmetsp:Transcript_45124/g.116726  ORF Transcript_45124/g.116726 Transcript_45124/m.116726 type:complete len:252 (+) Transcript_45124:655-1410(+)
MRRSIGQKNSSGASPLPPPPPPPKRELASITKNLANVRRVVRRVLNGGTLPPPPPPAGRPAVQPTPLGSSSPPKGEEGGTEEAGGGRKEAYTVEAHSAPSGLPSEYKDVQDSSRSERRAEEENTDILEKKSGALQSLSGQRAPPIGALGKDKAVDDEKGEAASDLPLPSSTESKEYLPDGGRQSSSSPPLDAMSPTMPASPRPPDGASPAARRALYGRSLGDMLAQNDFDEGRRPSRLLAPGFFKKGKSKT